MRRDHSALPVVLAALTFVSVAACHTDHSIAPSEHNGGLYLALGSKQVAPGDTLPYTVSFSLVDAPGDVAYLRLVFNGVTIAADTLEVPPRPEALDGAIIIPDSLATGTLTVKFIVPAPGDSTSGDVQILPRTTGRSLSAMVFSETTPAVFTTNALNRVIDFIAGRTDTVAVRAVDSAGIAWVGWEMGPPVSQRDSEGTAGHTVTVTFPMPSPVAGGSPSWLKVFARTTAGTLFDTTFTVGGVATYIDRPMRTAPLQGAVQDLVYDRGRNLLYLSEAGVPSIVVLSLGSMTFQSPIALPKAPSGLDLMPGDSLLVVGLANTTDLAIVRLSSAGQPATTVHTSGLGETTIEFPRVAADGRVMLVLGGASGGLGSYQPDSGTTTFYIAGWDGTAPTRTGDGTTVFMPNVAGCAFNFYDAVSHVVDYILNTCGIDLPGRASATENGSYYGLGVQVLNAGFANLVSAQVPDYPINLGIDYGTTVSNAGADFYVVAPALCGSGPCPMTSPAFFFHYALNGAASPPSLTLVDMVNTPETAERLLAIPGDQSLVAVGPTSIMVFDLTQSTVASVARPATPTGMRPERPRARR